MDYTKKYETQCKLNEILLKQNADLLAENETLRNALQPTEEVKALITELEQLKALWNEKLTDLSDIEEEYNRLINDIRTVRNEALANDPFLKWIKKHVN